MTDREFLYHIMTGHYTSEDIIGQIISSEVYNENNYESYFTFTHNNEMHKAKIESYIMSDFSRIYLLVDDRLYRFHSENRFISYDEMIKYVLEDLGAFYDGKCYFGEVDD